MSINTLEPFNCYEKVEVPCFQFPQELVLKSWGLWFFQ